MTWHKDQATDPKDSIDNGQDPQPDVNVDAATELVGEHGGHARDPHGDLLAQRQQHRREELRCPPNTAGCVPWCSNGWTGGPSLAKPHPNLPPLSKLDFQRNVQACFRVPLEWVIPKHGWGRTKYAQTELQMWWLDAVVLPTHESAQRGRNEQPRRSITNQSTQFYLLTLFASFTWEWAPPIHFKCIIILIFIIISVSDLLVLVVFFSNHLIHSWGCTENMQEINPLLDTNSHQQWS